MNSGVQRKGTLLCKCLQAGDALERPFSYRKKLSGWLNWGGRTGKRQRERKRKKIFATLESNKILKGMLVLLLRVWRSDLCGCLIWCMECFCGSLNDTSEWKRWRKKRNRLILNDVLCDDDDDGGVQLWVSERHARTTHSHEEKMHTRSTNEHWGISFCVCVLLLMMWEREVVENDWSLTYGWLSVWG